MSKILKGSNFTKKDGIQRGFTSNFTWFSRLYLFQHFIGKTCVNSCWEQFNCFSFIFFFVCRSSLSEVFSKNAILKNFAEFYSYSVVGCRPETLLKKRPPTYLFYCKFWEIFHNSFLIEHLWMGVSVVYCIQSMI